MQNNISRRTALAGLAGAGALSSIPAASAMLDTGAPAAPEKDDHGEGYTDAMDTFAFAWLQRWTDKGGSAYMGKIGKQSELAKMKPQLLTGFPCYHFSPLYKDDQAVLAAAPEPLPESVLRDRDRFNGDFYMGKMRELHDLMDAVPGGWEAVERIIGFLPSLGAGRTEPKPVEA